MTIPARPRVAGSRTVYRGRVFEAVVETLELPDTPGRTREVEIVRHAGSVGILAMPDPASLMLVRQYRHAVGEPMWELPAGSVDPGEQPEAAARRECHEELGLVAGSMERLGELFPLPGYCTELMTFFKATGLRPPEAGDPSAKQDEDEDIEARAFAVDEVRGMLRTGAIRDLKTAAALALLDRG